MGVQVRWDCDLDAGGSDCRPHYSFQLQETSYNFRCGPSCPPAAFQPGPPPTPHYLSWGHTLAQLSGHSIVCSRRSPGSGRVFSAPGPPAQAPAQALSSIPPNPIPLLSLGTSHPPAPPPPHPASSTALFGLGGRVLFYFSLRSYIRIFKNL